MSESITVFAPASVANLGVGYDILGLAIHGPGDEITARLSKSPGVRIVKITGDGGKLPVDAMRNTAGVAVIHLLHHLNQSDIGIELEIHKRMPFGSGLGSSAASAVGAVWATNLLLGSTLTKREVLHFAVLGEQIADGAYHADNVGPSLLGGIVLVRDNETLDIIELPVPADLWITVVYPHISVLTKDARQILKPHVSVETVVQQTGNLAGFISSLYLNDYTLLGRSLRDVWIEPQRAVLIPFFSEMKAIANELSALGFSISGAGPSVFALTDGKEKGLEIGKKLEIFLQSKDINSNSYCSIVNVQGCIQI
jgi:homoserine kinase